ncbi:uncharacterized protein [Cardiocondyla obscurior]|uniref:uncharacterized protein n=1 Tax=Cardiocondyla obscurior TaxID=286306 RepID=UPI0039658410
MSRQLRDRDHVNHDYQEGYGDFRNLRDLRDFRDFHRDTLDERDGPTTGRIYRDDYPEEYDHHPPAASTSANHTTNPVSRYSSRLYPPSKKIKRTSPHTPAELPFLLFPRHVALRDNEEFPIGTSRIILILFSVNRITRRNKHVRLFDIFYLKIKYKELD